MKNKKLLLLIFGISLFFQMIYSQNPGSVSNNFGSAPGFNYAAFNYNVNSIVIQPDGKMLIGGNFINYNGITANRILRLNSDGTRDSSFNIGNGFDNKVTSIVLQTDGKVLVGGDFTSYNGISASRILRLNSDGTIDNSFNSGAFFNSLITCLTIQSDGKVLVGGKFNPINRVFRLNTDGSIDNSFNWGTGFNNQWIYTIKVQTDGKILVGGKFTTYNGIIENNIIRLNSDGSRDVSFISGSGFNLVVYSIALQNDGKILIGGAFSSYNGIGGEQNLIRLNSNGTKDNSFSTSYGSTIVGFNNIVATIAVQTDGKILVGGDFTGYKGLVENKIIRLNIDGTKDNTFNIGTGFSESVGAIVLQNNGKIILGGAFRTYNGFTSNCIIRLEPNGTIDNTLNTNPLTGFDNIIYSTVFQPDGKIIVGGAFTSYNGLIKNRIIRLNVDGSIDNTFNIGIGFDGEVYSIALQIDGKILVGGTFGSYNGVGQRSIIRLNSDGSKDSTFATFNNAYGDFQAPNCSGCIAPIYSIVLQPDGKILVGGNFTEFGSDSFLTRLNANGTKDISFSTYLLFDGLVYSVFLEPNGKILVGGNFNQLNGSPNTYTGNKITRLNSNGSIDNTFNVGSGFINFQSQTCYIKSIISQPDGKILVGGKFVSYNGTIKPNLIRLNPDGTFDGGFAPLAILNSEVFAIGLQPDGKIIVGGKFTSYNDVNEYFIMCLNNDGTKDNNFNAGVGFNSFVTSITIGPNSKILVGGAFTTYMNSNTSSYLIELNGNSGALNNNENHIDKSTFYPNPVFDVINIKSSTAIRQVRIANILGQILMQESFNSNNIQFNLEKIPSGNYFVIIESDDKKEMLKIIKK